MAGVDGTELKCSRDIVIKADKSLEEAQKEVSCFVASNISMCLARRTLHPNQLLTGFSKLRRYSKESELKLFTYYRSSISWYCPVD